MVELLNLKYYDEDVWKQITDTMCRKHKINNLYYASYFYETMIKLNNDPNNPNFKKFDEKIELFAKKYFNEDRRWRYNVEEGRFRTLEELIERREESKQDDYYTT